MYWLDVMAVAVPQLGLSDHCCTLATVSHSRCGYEPSVKGAAVALSTVLPLGSVCAAGWPGGACGAARHSTQPYKMAAACGGDHFISPNLHFISF